MIMSARIQELFFRVIQLRSALYLTITWNVRQCVHRDRLLAHGGLIGIVNTLLILPKKEYLLFRNLTRKF